MYTGHAAIALVIKSRRPEVPMLPLLLAAYGPDWVDVVLMMPKPREGMAPYSHSIPAVVIGAALAAVLYRLTARRPGAGAIAVAWLLHWVADLVTGLKPLVGVEPSIGLDIYHLPWVDLSIEATIVVIACALYGKAFARQRWQRGLVVALGVSLLCAQTAFDWALSHIDTNPWRPSLAEVPWRAHVTPASGLAAAVHSACLLHCSPSLIRERVMSSTGPKGIVTLVCLTCGKEKFFTNEVPATVSCEQCGNTVFRTFATPTEPDDAAIDALEAQARSIAYGDSSPDTTRDDVRDLGLL